MILFENFCVHLQRCITLPSPFIQIFANTVFAFLRAMNCCKAAELSHENLSNRSQNTDNDAERRRAKALRSLDQRIQLETEFTVPQAEGNENRS